MIVRRCSCHTKTETETYSATDSTGYCTRVISLGIGFDLCNGVFTLAEIETETKTDQIGFCDNVQK